MKSMRCVSLTTRGRHSPTFVTRAGSTAVQKQIKIHATLTRNSAAVSLVWITSDFKIDESITAHSKNCRGSLYYCHIIQFWTVWHHVWLQLIAAPRWVVSGTVFHGGINLLLSGLCTRAHQGVWSPLRPPQILWGWKTLQMLMPKSVSEPFFPQICCLLCFLLCFFHTSYSSSAFVILISFVHIHRETYTVFKFKIFVLYFLFNTFLYSKQTVSCLSGWKVFEYFFTSVEEVMFNSILITTEQ